MERLIAWLADKVPADDGRVALVHGDWRIDNMIFDPKRRACSRSSTGSCRRSAIPSPTSPINACNGGCRAAGIERPRRRRPRGEGIPTEAEYVAAYCRRAGLNGIPDWTFLIAFSFFRYAAIPRASTSARSTATPRIRSSRGNSASRAADGAPRDGGGRSGGSNRSPLRPRPLRAARAPCGDKPAMLSGAPTLRRDLRLPAVGPGEVAEWSIAPHSKCGVRASVPGVRIPPSPPTSLA